MTRGLYPVVLTAPFDALVAERWIRIGGRRRAVVWRLAQISIARMLPIRRFGGAR